MSEFLYEIEREYTAHSSESFPIRIADYVPIDPDGIASLQATDLWTVQEKNSYYSNRVRTTFRDFINIWDSQPHWMIRFPHLADRKPIPLIELTKPDNRNHTHLVAVPGKFSNELSLILKAAGNRVPRYIDYVHYRPLVYPRRPRDTEKTRAQAIKEFRQTQVAERFLTEVMQAADVAFKQQV